jgi:hypothetical protein
MLSSAGLRSAKRLFLRSENHSGDVNIHSGEAEIFIHFSPESIIHITGIFIHIIPERLFTSPGIRN